MTEYKQCTGHVELCEKVASLVTKLDDIAKIVNERGPKINGKASTSQMKWIVGVFIAVSLAVVGFLYDGQRELAKEIKDAFKDVSYEMKVMSNQIIRQGAQLEEHMNNQDNLNAQYQRDRNKWDADRKEYEKKIKK